MHKLTGHEPKGSTIQHQRMPSLPLRKERQRHEYRLGKKNHCPNRKGDAIGGNNGLILVGNGRIVLIWREMRAERAETRGFDGV